MCIDGVVVRVCRARSRVARQVGHARVGQPDEVGSTCDTGSRSQGGRPCDPTVGSGQVTQAAVVNREIRNGEARDSFAEDDADCRSLASGQQRIGHHDAGRWRPDVCAGAKGQQTGDRVVVECRHLVGQQCIHTVNVAQLVDDGIGQLVDQEQVATRIEVREVVPGQLAAEVAPHHGVQEGISRRGRAGAFGRRVVGADNPSLRVDEVPERPLTVGHDRRLGEVGDVGLRWRPGGEQIAAGERVAGTDRTGDAVRTDDTPACHSPWFLGAGGFETSSVRSSIRFPRHRHRVRGIPTRI